MKPQPSIPEEAQQWLRLAFDDLRLADLAVDAEPPMTGLALYHAQQAAEKSLKDSWFRVAVGILFPITLRQYSSRRWLLIPRWNRWFGRP